MRDWLIWLGILLVLLTAGYACGVLTGRLADRFLP
jgi:hypothetical protein